ncbi:hypothetical protein HGA92_03185 [Candidatus Gracilibacteria bacterium]|nr:hypothetical protein [Candidatus Gracilibacteria bacterium]NUJ99109.1 hypothetical protein [Candidatus Gracilibacteria bacterium]
MDLSQAGKLMKLQQDAMKIKKELENTIIEAEVGGLVISVNGEMKVEKVEFETLDLIPGLSQSQKEALEKAILESVNKGVKKSQELASEKMQGVMGQMGLNIPGMS